MPRPRREEALDDPIVQVAGDALPVLQHRHVAFGRLGPLFHLQACGQIPGDRHHPGRAAPTIVDRMLEYRFDGEVGSVLAAVHGGVAVRLAGREAVDERPELRLR